MQKYLQKFSGNFGIEPIFISWDIVVFVIFDIAEILLNSAVFRMPRKNEISFYAPRMWFDQIFKNYNWPGKIWFLFVKIVVFLSLFCKGTCKMKSFSLPAPNLIKDFKKLFDFFHFSTFFWFFHVWLRKHCQTKKTLTKIGYHQIFIKSASATNLFSD